MFSQLTVGERLKMARRAAKYGGEELGRFIGVGKSQISNIENDKSELTRGNAIVLSEKLGVSLNWLLTGEGEMIEQPRGNPPGYYSGRNNTATNTVSVGAQQSAAENVELMVLREKVISLESQLKKCEEQNKRLFDQLFSK